MMKRAHPPVRNLEKLLDLEKKFGVDVLPRSTPPEVPAVSSDPFESLRSKVLSCTLCRLHEKRTHAVFGVGNPKAALMFVGEGPGQDEDLQGEPFVGRAGKLLTATLKKLGVRREQVYITNIVKCRPPENREPWPDEIATCLPYLKKQIASIGPKFICALGRPATQTLLGSVVSISRVRGRVHDCDGLNIFPSFHPAYILRNPQDTPIFEQDLRQVCVLAGLIRA